MAFLLAYLSVGIAVVQHFLQHSNRLGIPPIIVARLLMAVMACRPCSVLVGSMGRTSQESGQVY